MSGRDYPMLPVLMALASAGFGFAPMRVDIMDDRLDTLGFVMGDEPPRPMRQTRPTKVFIDTPKPISKRKARRLRGKVQS